MRKLRSAFYSVLLAGTLALTLTGCGSSSNPGSTASNATTAATASSSWADVGVTSGNQQITLSWTDTTAASSSSTSSTTTAPAPTYNVYFKNMTTGSAAVTKKTGTLIANVTTPFLHTGLTNGKKYAYVVTKVVNGQESAESSQVAAVPQAAAPAAPTGITIKPADSQVTIMIAPPANAPTGMTYNLYWYYYDTTTTPNTKVTGTITNVFPGTSTGFTHYPLVNGRQYYYYVTAVLAGVESAASATFSAVPQANITPVNYSAGPPAVQAQLGAPNNVTGANGNQQVTLTWTSTNATMPTLNGTSIKPGSSVFNIYWSTSYFSSTQNSGVSKISVPASQITTSPPQYTLYSLTNGQAYYYQITETATTTNGTALESPAGSEISVTPSAKTPAAPAGITAVTGNQQVALSWTKDSSGFSNVYYNVYASKQQVTDARSLVSPANIIGTTTSNAFVHSGLQTGVPYSYVVTAVAEGESAPSAIVTVTP